MMTIFIFTQKTCPPRNNLVAQYIRRAFCFIVCSNWLFYVNSIATHLAYLYGKKHVVFHLVKHRFLARKWSYSIGEEGTFHTIIGFKTRCRLLYDSAKRGVIFCGYMFVYQLVIVACEYAVLSMERNVRLHPPRSIEYRRVVGQSGSQLFFQRGYL